MRLNCKFIRLSDSNCRDQLASTATGEALLPSRVVGFQPEADIGAIRKVSLRAESTALLITAVLVTVYTLAEVPQPLFVIALNHRLAGSLGGKSVLQQQAAEEKEALQKSYIDEYVRASN